MFISNEPRGMEHCLFLMNLEVWNMFNIVYILMNLEVWNIVYGTLFISNEPRGMEHCLFNELRLEHCLFLMNQRYGTLFISNEPRGMEHCLFLMNLEAWNIVYF